MMPGVEHAVPALLVGASLSFLLGAGGDRDGRSRAATVATAAGFGTLAVAFLVVGVDYALSSRPYRPVAVPVAGLAVVVALQGIRLSLTDWHRRRQLTTMMAAFLVVVAPFEVAPDLHIFVQEWYARQTAALVGSMGAHAALSLSDAGHLTVLRFENGGFLRIVRECNGVYAIAIFTALLAGARTSLRRKLGGFCFAFTGVVVVNLLRLSFVALALANDWFGPLVTDGNTVQTTYYVAEFGVGQTLVVVTTIAGFLLVDRWIPDVLDFIAELTDSFEIPALRPR